jgi:MarR-like DNA-binding transcriptional regulator SgrR of sgrS sRNA
MPRVLIILVICCAYVGCAVPRTSPVESPPPPAEQGALRILVGSGLSADEAAALAEAHSGEVQLVGDGGDPVLMLQLEEADAAVLWGRQVGELEEAAGDRYQLERLRSWDRSYLLQLNPATRWVNDPTFRRWLAATVDREEMLEHLFDGRGEPAFSLTPGRADGPLWERPQGKPFSATSEPRMELRYDGGDERAASIAARLKAVLEAEGVRLSLSPIDVRRFPGRLPEGVASIALVRARRRPPDVVSAVREIIEPLGEEATAELDLLERAARHDDEGVRTEMAWWAESSTLRDARIVPLVRLHYWLARRSP